MARSAGSEQRLWGGSGARPNYVWCAGALVIPGAQCSQCLPVGFGGACHFGGAAVAHDKQATTSGWSMVPNPSYLLWLGALANPNSNIHSTTRKLCLVTLEL